MTRAPRRDRASPLAVGWAVAAWLLCATASCRATSSLPTVDVDAVFGRELVDDAERYERFLLADWVLSQVVLFATLAVYARYGARYARESAAGPIGTGMLLGMLGLAIVWLAQLPFALAALWWERRHDVSEVGYLEAVFGGWLGLGGTFVAVCIALLVVMALARRLGSWWWIPGAAVFALIASVLVLRRAVPRPGLERPDDPQLVRTYERFERAQGVDDIPLRDRGGLGRHEPGERLRVRDGPVLDDRPVGHAARRPVQRRGGGRRPRARARPPLEQPHPRGDRVVRAVRAAGRAGPDARDAGGRGGMGEPARGAARAPRRGGLPARRSRRPRTSSAGESEAEADWKALQTTRDPAAATGLFREFSETSLGDPSPPTWAYVLLQTHPTLAQRVAMADAWAARQEQRVSD